MTPIVKRSVIALVLLVMLAGCAAGLRSSVPGTSPGAADALATVYVVRRGWHIDICFAASDLRAPLSLMKRWLPDAKYLVFGFGDRRFLLGHEHNLFGALAALWPGKGVVLVTGIANTPVQAFGAEHIVSLRLDSAQETSMQQYVWQTLSHPEGPLAPAAPGPYSGSVYFSADPPYSAAHTCNTWAAEALKAGGLQINSRGTVLAPQLWHQVQRIAPAAPVPRDEASATSGSSAGRLGSI